MAAYLPVPITAAHTTNSDYCYGEGLLSRKDLAGNGAVTVYNHSIIGNMLRHRAPLGTHARSEIDIPSGITGLTLGMFIFLVGPDDSTPAGVQIIEFLNASGQEVFNINRVLSTGILQLRRGSTVLGALTTATSGTVANFFEFDIEFHDSTGVVVARANNAEEVNLTGQDTINNAGPVTKVRLSGGSGNPVLDIAFGHGYIKDRGGSTNFWGRGAVRYAPYGADAAPNEFTPSTGTNHNALQDETDPDGDTTKLTSSTDGHEERMAPPSPVITGPIRCMWNYQGAKQDGGAVLKSILEMDTSGDVIDATGRLVPFGAYGGVATAYEVDPDTSAAWTDFSNILEIGYKLGV